MTGKTYFYNLDGSVLIKELNQPVQGLSGKIRLEFAPNGTPEHHNYAIDSYITVITISGDVYIFYYLNQDSLKIIKSKHFLI